MKRQDVHVGGRYLAKISGRLVTVRVLAIREIPPPPWGKDGDRWRTRIDCVNEATNRQITLASPQRLRQAVEG
ncbi:MAG: hypothetical protein AB7E74_26420 [Pirellulales bacterium]